MERVSVMVARKAHNLEDPVRFWGPLQCVRLKIKLIKLNIQRIIK